MLRATITDIAERSGTSTATVDRVLNGRSGVSAINRQKVIQAAQDLNYLPTQGQTVLPPRPVQLEFFLPRNRQAFLHDVADRIESFAKELPLVSQVRVHDLPDMSQETIAAALNTIHDATRGVGLVAIDHPRTRQQVRDLVDAGIKVITIASDLISTPRAAYVGIDDRVAGRTAGLLMGRLAGQRAGKVGLFVGQRALHGQREREIGFRSVLEHEFPGLDVLPAIDVRTDNRRAEMEIDSLLARVPDLVGIYNTGGGRTGIATALSRLPVAQKPFLIMHDLSDTTRRFLAQGVIDLIIDQNARLLAEQAVIRLLGAVASSSLFLPQHFIEPRLIFRENIPN